MPYMDTPKKLEKPHLEIPEKTIAEICPREYFRFKMARDTLINNGDCIYDLIIYNYDENYSLETINQKTQSLLFTTGFFKHYEDLQEKFFEKTGHEIILEYDLRPDGGELLAKRRLYFASKIELSESLKKLNAIM